MMKKTLIVGFKGNDNSAKVLLDNIEENSFVDKLYLDNDFSESEKQLFNKLDKNNYEVIYAFGQKQVIKSIYIELVGIKNSNKLMTDYNYGKLESYLKEYYKVKISNNAGNYLCNNIYYEGLNYIKSNNLKVKLIFIHVPVLKNINIIEFASIFKKYYGV